MHFQCRCFREIIGQNIPVYIIPQQHKLLQRSVKITFRRDVQYERLLDAILETKCKTPGDLRIRLEQPPTDMMFTVHMASEKRIIFGNHGRLRTHEVRIVSI